MACASIVDDIKIIIIDRILLLIFSKCLLEKSVDFNFVRFSKFHRIIIMEIEE